MLRLFFRLYLRLILGFIVFVAGVNYALYGVMKQENLRMTRAMASGQVYQLQQYFNPLTPGARPAALTALQAHFGLQLSLHPAGGLALSRAQQRELAAGDFVVLSEDGALTSTDSALILPLQGGQWLQVTIPPDPSWLGWASLGANLVVFALLAALLWHWSSRHWRDLAQLGAAARAMGQGHLEVRADLPKKSDLHQLATHFNQMAAQLQLLVTQQNEMIHGVAHELRTPMARMAFELDLLAASSDAAEQQQLQTELRSELQELEQLISEMLSYCRLQQQAQPWQSVPAADWLASALADAELEARQYGVTLIGEAPAQHCQLEPRLLARALSNLLRNALRYATQRVEVRLTAEAQHWVLTVDDDGPGIAPDDRLRVFEPFTRLDQSRNRASGGFGLGLAVVRRIAQWHGGEVSASQSPLGGARLQLRWPLQYTPAGIGQQENKDIDQSSIPPTLN
ncbi:ATP-binding protein [Chitinibacter tainanensis]|uniref:ATP-binding protein n=1 Tax=Chitinibacter tainanensis TaxID=230667 RepID=UPI0004078AE7|nr:ATP-binding protein [Chitinibacter tainanensis]